MSLRSIEIDWDIHKAIEAERRNFDEPQYIALRRLLGMPAASTSPARSIEEMPDISAGLPWYEDGVQIPHGSDARMRYSYNRQVFHGRFLNGHLVVNGERFDSLSRAANALARTKAGSKTQLNGWKYWEVRLPGDENWTRLEDLRDQTRKELASKVHFTV